jgi:hypothetical protein
MSGRSSVVFVSLTRGESTPAHAKALRHRVAKKEADAIPAREPRAVFVRGADVAGELCGR